MFKYIKKSRRLNANGLELYVIVIRQFLLQTCKKSVNTSGKMHITFV